MDSGVLTFLLPADSDAVSGGNIYNAELMSALGPMVPVRALPIDQLRAIVAGGAPGLYFVDSLNLEEARILSSRAPEQTFVLIVHHLPSWEPDIDPGDERIRREQATLPLFDALLSTSPFTAAALAGRGHGVERILTVSPGVSAGDRPALVYQPRPRALLVGNLIPRKSIREFLGALAQRVDSDGDFHIDIVGRTDLDVPYARDCIRLAAASPSLASSVQIHGPIPHALVDAFYRRAGLFLSTARFESFGMALQEARVFGLPILACDGGNARNHFTQGKTGLLFGSVAALVDGFVDLIRDPPRMRALFESSQRLRANPQDNRQGTWSAAADRLLQQLGPWLNTDLRKGKPRAT